MPTPTTSVRSILRSSIFLRMLFAQSGRIALPSSSVTVGISHFSIRSPLVLKRPSFTVVPPTSTPKQYLPILFSSRFSRIFKKLFSCLICDDVLLFCTIRQLHRCTEHYRFPFGHFGTSDRFSPHPRPHPACAQGNSGLLYTAPVLHCIPSFSVCG